MNKFIKMIKAESSAPRSKYDSHSLQMTIELLPERLFACVEADACMYTNHGELDAEAKRYMAHNLVESMTATFRKELERVLHEEAARKNPRPITDAF